MRQRQARCRKGRCHTTAHPVAPPAVQVILLDPHTLDEPGNGADEGNTSGQSELESYDIVPHNALLRIYVELRLSYHQPPLHPSTIRQLPVQGGVCFQIVLF